MENRSGILQLFRALTTHSSLIKILTVIAVLAAIGAALDQRALPSHGVFPPNAMAISIVAGAGLIALALDGRS